MTTSPMFSKLLLCKIPLSKILVLGVMMVPLACSGGDGRPEMADLDDEELYEDVAPDAEADAAADSALPDDEPVCLDGEEVKCTVKLPTQNGVPNCFVGVQVCEGGQWGACVETTGSDNGKGNGKEGS